MNTLGNLDIGHKIYVCGETIRQYESVKKIGRIYFTVNISGVDTKFRLSDWRQKPTHCGYGYDYKLYKDEAEYLARVKLSKAHSRVASVLFHANSPVLTIDQYLEIEKWINMKADIK